MKDKTLFDLAPRTRCTVTGLAAPRSLCERLRALGMGEGERIELLRVSAARRVFYVRTAFATAALGAEAAHAVMVRA